MASSSAHPDRIGKRSRVRRVPSRSPSPVSPEDSDPFEDASIICRPDVIFPDFKSFGIKSCFTTLGWLGFFKLKGPVYPSLVREFYQKFQTVANGGYYSSVLGVNLYFSSEDLDRLIGAPTTSPKRFSLKGWPLFPNFDQLACLQRLTGSRVARPWKPKGRDLLLPARILHKVIGHTIHPTQGHKDEVSCFEFYLLDCLIQKEKISLGYIIGERMSTIARLKSNFLPYGEVITCLLLSHQLDIEAFDSIVTDERLGRETLINMRLTQLEDGSWVDSRPPRGSGASSASTSSQPQPAPRPAIVAEDVEEDPLGPDSEEEWEFNWASYADLHTRLDHVQSDISSLDRQVRALSLTQNTYFQQLTKSQEAFFEEMRQRLPPPPPPPSL